MEAPYSSSVPKSEHAEVKILQANQGFNGFGIFDLPIESGLYRRQFFMSNKPKAKFVDGQGVFTRSLSEIAKVHYEGRPTLPHLSNDTEQLRFIVRGQEIFGGMSVRFMAATGFEVNLYSSSEIPQDVTDRIWYSFEAWNRS